MATASDALSQPLLFTFPGSLPPRDWPAARRGDLQAPGGFGRLEVQTLRLPQHVSASEALCQVAAVLGARIEHDPYGTYRLDLALSRHGGAGKPSRRLPACALQT